LYNGKVLVAGGTTSTSAGSAALYDPGDGSLGVFSATGGLGTARTGHTATRLTTGKVLFAGGKGVSADLASAELYDSQVDATGAALGGFSATGSLATARRQHTATLLYNSKVLVAGGVQASTATPSVELFGTSTFTANIGSGLLGTGRFGHTATRLPNGKVLIAGGSTGGGFFTNTAELYTTSTNVLAATGNLVTARAAHTATLLSSGKVLIAGGVTSGGGTVTAALELYDPAGGAGAGTFAAAGVSLGTARQLHTATLLPNGQVLISGGVDSNGNALFTSELYNPNASCLALPCTTPAVSSSSATFSYERTQHSGTLLPGGKVLFAGGFGISGAALDNAELYAVAPTDAFTFTGSLGFGVAGHTATLLTNGLVLVGGGSTGSSTSPTASSTAKVYQ
jgi:hypothetical protein